MLKDEVNTSSFFFTHFIYPSYVLIVEILVKQEELYGSIYQPGTIII